MAVKELRFVMSKSGPKASNKNAIEVKSTKDLKHESQIRNEIKYILELYFKYWLSFFRGNY